MATAVAHFPSSWDKGPLERARRPLAAIAAVILVIDLFALGLHLVDAVERSFPTGTPNSARARVGAPEAVVPSATVAGAQERAARSRSGQAAQPLGCLALDSGCYAGGTPSGGGTATPPGPTTGPPAGPPRPVPVAQADIGVPALGAQVSLGLGNGGCTSVELTVLALGDCPVENSDGPVVLNLGGSLLGD